MFVAGRQMSVKGNWIRQLQPVLNVVPMAVTATRWAVVIVVTPTGPLPPWPYTKHSWHTAGSYFELSDLDDCGQLNSAKTMQRSNLCFMQYQWQQHIESCSPGSLWRAATVLPQRRAEVFSCLLSLFMPNPSADVKSKCSPDVFRFVMQRNRIIFACARPNMGLRWALWPWSGTKPRMKHQNVKDVLCDMLWL